MKTQPTQKQMYDAASRKIADGNELFLEMVKDGTMTRATLTTLIAKRPAVYSRFANFLETLS